MTGAPVDALSWRCVYVRDSLFWTRTGAQLKEITCVMQWATARLDNLHHGHRLALRSSVMNECLSVCEREWSVCVCAHVCTYAHAHACAQGRTTART